MSNTEILNKFNEKREFFCPYGLTCELWTPNLMLRPDRHNEIELNYLPKGSITYLFQDKKVVVSEHRLTLFWGLIPHQIVYYEHAAPYYVCTVPLSQFLTWKLPAVFVDRIFKGEVVVDCQESNVAYDERMFENWIGEVGNPSYIELLSLELHARLLRTALSTSSAGNALVMQRHEFSLVERIAIYIVQNYSKRLTLEDVGVAVGLNPDYANSIFRKAFGYTIYDYIIQERISHAQRQLVLSDKNITQIAYECGFNSINRFNFAFLRISGCTPRDYKKRYIVR